MTECNTKRIDFSRASKRQIVADFLGGQITSDAGLLLLREILHKLRLPQRISQLIPDPRAPEWIVHTQSSMLAQRIAAIATGHEDLNDHQTLRDDPTFQLISREMVDVEQPLASPPTLCRLENRIERKELVDMNALLVEMFVESACRGRRYVSWPLRDSRRLKSKSNRTQ